MDISTLKKSCPLPFASGHRRAEGRSRIDPERSWPLTPGRPANLAKPSVIGAYGDRETLQDVHDHGRTVVAADTGELAKGELVVSSERPIHAKDPASLMGATA